MSICWVFNAVTTVQDRYFGIYYGITLIGYYKDDTYVKLDPISLI